MMNAPLKFRVFMLGLVFAFGILQIRLWLSEDGWSEVLRLRSSVEAQRRENDELEARNERLRAEVADLKSGFSALEERARADLGMVAEDEAFFLIVPAPAEEESR